MTYAALKQSVLDLGWDDNVDQPTVMVTSTNRAMAEINRLRPMVSEFIIVQEKPVYPTVIPRDFDRYLPAPVEGVYTFEADGVKAVSFAYFGVGSIEVKEEDGTTSFSESLSSPTYATFKKNLPTKAHRKIVVNGVTLARFALWGMVNGTTDAVVPMFGEYNGYTLGAFADDYVEPESAPYIIEDRCQLYNISIDAQMATLYVPCHFEGSIHVPYRRKLRLATLDDFKSDSQEQVDVWPPLDDLLPLLVASYVWLYDEPTKAAYYKQQYEEQALLWQTKQRMTVDNRVIDRKGWR